MLKFIKKITIPVFISILIAWPSFAANLKDSFGSESGIDNLAKKAGYNPTNIGLESYIGTILTALFSILGVISIALLIYSGYIWMTARGNESKVTEAKENIFNIIIGLIFIIGSYALTTFLLKIFS